MTIKRKAGKNMKKIFSVLLVVMMLMASFGTVTIAADEHISIFVQQGASGGNGSMDSPFGTFNEARDYIRALKKNGQYPKNGVTVYFREGKYFLTEGFKLNEEDSGIEGGPVVYRPWANEEVSFVGGVALPLSEFQDITDEKSLNRLHKNAKGKVKRVNLKDYGITDYGKITVYGNVLGLYKTIGYPYETDVRCELFFNDTRMDVARWPNNGEEAVVEKAIDEGSKIDDFREVQKNDPNWRLPPLEEIKGFEFQIKDSLNEKPWKNWKTSNDIVIYGRLCWEWSDEGYPCTVDENGIVKSDFPIGYGIKAGANFYLWNIIEELDVKGEWYLDRDNGDLYFYPPESSGEVVLSCLSDSIFDLQNAEHISIKGFTLNSTKNHGIQLNKCKNVNVEGLTIKNMTVNGIYSNLLENCTIASCHVFNCGEIGVHLDGGDKDKYIKANNIITNCLLHTNARLKETYAPGIRLTGCGNTASHNEIYDMPHAGLIYNGSYNIMEYNNIHHVCLSSNDMGAIYSFRMRTNVGSVVRHNYIHDLVNFKSDIVRNYYIGGVYLDGYRSFQTVENNIFENLESIGIISAGRANNFTNNIFINVRDAFNAGEGQNIGNDVTDADLADTGLMAVRQGKLDLSQPPYSEVPYLSNIMEDEPMASKYILWKNNVLINSNEVAYGGKNRTFEEWKEVNFFHESMVTTKENAGFVNTAKGNYLLKEDSKIYEKFPDFVPCDFINVGPYTDWVEYKLKNTISLKIGSPMALVNFKNEFIDPENAQVLPVLIDGTTYVPLRFIAETLGSTVDYNKEESLAKVTSGANVLEVKLNSGEVLFNGTALNGKVLVENNRSLVPLRVISEAFGKSVSWYKQGLIVIGDAEYPIPEDNTKWLGELDRRLSNN